MTLNTQRAATRIGGYSLIAAAVGFLTVFSWLAVKFNYPDVLDAAAADVLPQLLSLGTTGRAVWSVYALLPLLLIPAAIGARAALKDAAPNAMQGAVILATLAALSMLFGLARWPTIHWELASSYATASPDARTTIDAVFAGLNLYLGNFIGEFLGEIAMNGFFILTGFAALRSPGAPRWFAIAGMVVGVAGLVGAFRNVTAIVDPVAEVNNYLLMLWLIVMGVVLARWPERRPAEGEPR